MTDLLASLPRRPRMVQESVDVPTLRAPRRDLPPASWGHVGWRTLQWIVMGLLMLAGWLKVRLRGKVTEQELGRLLREMLERLGGTAVKLGQQLSIRVDLIPAGACAELERLTDRVPPFSSAYALERIEACTDEPLATIFEAFDPEPIGSASVACVFKAVLCGGDEVAVKVRRRGVGEQFAADLTCFQAICATLERLTIVRPGFFRNLISQLREMFAEELDFVSEARYQRLFRRRVAKDGIDWVSAPKVYHRLCGEDVVTSEFSPGLSCTEVVAIQESGDAGKLAELAAQDIDPVLVGNRLWHMALWGRFEAAFFHADPHPGNLLILPGSRIRFLDFGACGSLSGEARTAQLAMVERSVGDDYEAMSQAAMANLSPVPNIDVDEVINDLNDAFYKFLFALRDPKAEWWERSTAGVWIGFLEVSRKHRIPIHIDLLRVLRSTLLYDTLAARLNPEFSDAEFFKYNKQRQRRLADKFRERLEQIRPRDQLPELGLRTGRSFQYLGQRIESGLESLVVSTAAVAKIAEVAGQVLQAAGLSILMVVFLAVWILISQPATQLDARMLIDSFVSHNGLLLIVLITLRAVRRIQMRLQDTDR